MVEKIQVKDIQRETVEVVMDDGTIMWGPRHTPIGEFMKVYQ